MINQLHGRLLAALIATTIGVVAVARPAGAEPDKAKARALFKQGNRLLSKKDYEAALAKFREAAKLFPSYKIDLNIATTLTSMGRLAEAAQFYDRFLHRGIETAPPGILSAARVKLDELKGQVAVIKLSSEVAGAQVTINGKPAGQTPIPGNLYVMPGPCQLAVTKEGHQPFAETLSLAPGQVKPLTAALAAIAPEPKPEPKPEPEPEPEPEPTPVDDSGSWKKTAGWITLAVGGASLVTGVIFSGLAASKASEHDEAVAAKKEYEIVQGLADDNATLKTGQIVTLVIGGVAAAAGGGLLLWHYLGGDGGAGERSAVLLPIADGERVGASLSVRF